MLGAGGAHSGIFCAAGRQPGPGHELSDSVEYARVKAIFISGSVHIGRHRDCRRRDYTVHIRVVLPTVPYLACVRYGVWRTARARP